MGICEACGKRYWGTLKGHLNGEPHTVEQLTHAIDVTTERVHATLNQPSR